MQRDHAGLTDGIGVFQEDLLGCGDGLVVEMRDQAVGGFPRFIIRFANDEVQTNAEGYLVVTAFGLGRFANSGDLFADLCRRLTPGQIFVDETDGKIDAGL